MRLFLWELRKLLDDSAARAGLIVTAAVLLVALAGFAVRSDDEPGATVTRKIAAGEIPVPAIYRKGLGFASFCLGPAAGILVPAVACVVLAGLMAGESERGTLAEVLARPVVRWQLIAAKLAAGLVYLALLMAVAFFVAVALAPLVLGAGELLTGVSTEVQADLQGGTVGSRISAQVLAGGQAFARLTAAYAVAALALAPVAALAVLASTAASTARTAAVVSSGVYFGLYTIARIPGLGSARRYVIVGHMEVWKALLGTEIGWRVLLFGGMVLAVTFAFLAAAAVVVFGGRQFPPRE